MSRLDEIKKLLKGYDNLRFWKLEDVEWLIARVEKLEEALKFYADKDYYRCYGDEGCSYIGNEAGERAREALEE